MIRDLLFLIGGCISGYIASHIMDMKSIIVYILKQYTNYTSIEKIQKNVYMLPYTYRGKQYKIFLHIRKGPKKVTRVYNEYGDDVTTRVQSFMGPSENFHNSEITPVHMDYSELHFHTSCGNVLSFTGQDTIDLSVPE